MTVVGTILSSDLRLIGLRLRHKNTFKNFRVSDLIANKFKCSQIDCTTGSIIELGSFKLRDLPCFGATKVNGIVPIDNSIELECSIIDSETNEVLGYTIRFKGLNKKLNLKTSQVYAISFLFKPLNFTIYSNGNKYVVKGINGCKVSELPSLLFNRNGAAKKENVAAENKVVEFDEIKELYVPKYVGNVTSDLDVSSVVPIHSIIDVFTNINVFKAVVVGRYKDKTDKTDKEIDNNIRFIDGASNSNGKVMLSSNNLNAFVRYSYGIMVNIGGNEYPAKMTLSDAISKDKKDIYQIVYVMVNKNAINDFMRVFDGLAKIVGMDECERHTSYSENCLKVMIKLEGLPLVSNDLKSRYNYSDVELEKRVVRLKQLKACMMVLNDYPKAKGFEDKSFVDFKMMRYYSSHFTEKQLYELEAKGLDVTTGIYRSDTSKKPSHVDNSKFYAEFNVDGANSLVKKNILSDKIPEILNCSDLRDVLRFYRDSGIDTAKWKELRNEIMAEADIVSDELWMYRYFNTDIKTGFNDGKNWSRIESKRISGDKVKYQLVGTSVVLTMRQVQD